MTGVQDNELQFVCVIQATQNMSARREIVSAPSRLCNVSFPVPTVQFEACLIAGYDVLRDWTKEGMYGGYCLALPKPKPKLPNAPPKVYQRYDAVGGM
jgi:hypothetical protein